ncbi:AsmA-like C-terminal region-containing protein, partial [Nostoc sp. NIES-2111]
PRSPPATPPPLGQSLNGTLSLRLDQGRLANFNLTNQLASLAQFLGYSTSPSNFTQFRALSGDLNIQNGRAQTQNLTLDMEHINSTVTGAFNLADQSLDLKILSVLDTSFSNQVGGNRIGGFMTAALSNGRGGLLIPATLKGTFQKPQMAPDAGAIAKLKLQSLNPANPKQVMDQVESVIGIFRKKK